MENSEILDNITCNIKCQICYEKFIKLTHKEFYKFLEDNKELIPNTFEDNYCCRCYEDRFECLTCKNIICKDCYWSFKNHKFRPDNEFIEEFIYFDRLDENGLAEGTPGEDCPIICPFCRTKDYKIFYGNQVPYEILNEIKIRGLKLKKV
jgi:hypothetical protein